MGLRVVVDIVPNHSSNRHPSFREALVLAVPVRRPGVGAGGRRAAPIAVSTASGWVDAAHGLLKDVDGCRVPLPWTRTGPSLGFGSGGTTLPQPAAFADFSVEAEEADPDSTLSRYRRALALRRELGSAGELTWVDDAPDVLHVARPGGWRSVTNFGDDPVALPAGEVLIASAPLDAGTLPANATAWIRATTLT